MIRRVFLLFVLLPLAVVASLGQDNQNATEMDEIFQKGRKWIVMGEAFVSPSVGHRVFWINGYECEGDTVVEGHLCSVMSCYSKYDIDNPFNVDEEALFSSEENKTWKNSSYVYRDNFRYYQFYPNEKHDDKFLFDFSVNNGDTLHLYTPGPGDIVDEELYTLSITGVSDTVMEDSSDRRVRKTVYVSYCGEPEIWIEGIGSLTNGPFGCRFAPAGGINTLFKCFDDENIYYSDQTVPWDKNQILSIRNTEDSETYSKKNEGVQGTYTLQGIKIISPSKGIHIIRNRDGKTQKVYRPY